MIPILILWLRSAYFSFLIILILIFFYDRHSYPFVLILIGKEGRKGLKGKKGKKRHGLRHEARCCGRPFSVSSAFEPAKRPLKRPHWGHFCFRQISLFRLQKNEMKSIRSHRLFRRSRRFRKHCSFKPSIDSCFYTTLILITDTYITWPCHVLKEAARPKVYFLFWYDRFFLTNACWRVPSCFQHEPDDLRPNRQHRLRARGRQRHLLPGETPRHHERHQQRGLPAARGRIRKRKRKRKRLRARRYCIVYPVSNRRMALKYGSKKIFSIF